MTITIVPLEDRVPRSKLIQRKDGLYYIKRSRKPFSGAMYIDPEYFRSQALTPIGAHKTHFVDGREDPRIEEHFSKNGQAVKGRYITYETEPASPLEVHTLHYYFYSNGVPRWEHHTKGSIRTTTNYTPSGGVLSIQKMRGVPEHSVMPKRLRAWNTKGIREPFPASVGWLPEGQIPRVTELLQFHDNGQLALKVSARASEVFNEDAECCRDGTLVQKIGSSGYVRSMELKDGIPNGEFTVVDQNGRTIQEGTYAEGYREGAWCDWTFVDGEISSEAIEVYKDGLKNGICRALTYEDGEICSESIETFKDGLLDGYRVGEPIIDGFLDFVQHSDFNVAKVREFYVAGELHGLRIGFDDEGNTVIREHYEYGWIKMFEEIDFDTGITRQIVQFKDGKKHGVKLLFHEDGRLEEFTELRKGKENGVTYQFSRRGHLKRISKRKDDFYYGDDWSFEKTGIASSRSIIGDHMTTLEEWDFHDDGSVLEHCIYRKSGKLGLCKVFNQKGEDVSNGRWEYFDKKGRLKVTGEHKKGLKHGVWTAYSKKGNPTISELYENGKFIKRLDD